MEHLLQYLSGDAFTVWSQMESADLEDEGKVESSLKELFSVSAGEAYSQFVMRVKQPGETVDAYLADLNCLLQMSWHKEAMDGKDPMLLAKVLFGMPVKFTNQPRLSTVSSAGGLALAV